MVRTNAKERRAKSERGKKNEERTVQNASGVGVRGWAVLAVRREIAAVGSSLLHRTISGHTKIPSMATPHTHELESVASEGKGQGFGVSPELEWMREIPGGEVVVAEGAYLA